MFEKETLVNRTNSSFLSKVYGWMTVGLALTASVAYYISSQPKIVAAIFNNFAVILVLFFVQIALVAALSFYISKMSFSLAALTFIGYSILSGVTLSSIFLVYTQSSIAVTFFVAAGMFAAMALYGYLTKSDLSSMGSFLFMAVIGLAIALLINMFLKSEMFDYIISGIGVIIFSLLTAYDMQQIKLIGSQMSLAGEDQSKISIICALKLYLDFINLFLYLLRFMGKKNND
ncbi:MAG: Bax inhibitor-1/YccA family protein [Candidatus Babeliales bacterium]|nr:Bax inhibitor-1/YccA family protein [Candidatus Babeliales bacterium]